jgi:hypothetical protein
MSRIRLTGDRNQCPSCGAFFNSTGAFDAHRTRVDPAEQFPRRCLTLAEMRAKGMQQRGSFWITGPRPALLRSAAADPAACGCAT